MIIQISGILLFVIFVLVSSVHFYWAFGGKWGVDAALPSNGEGERVLNPRQIDTFAVAAVFAGIGVFYLVMGTVVVIDLPLWMPKYLGWIFPFVFLIRAVGDFKYVGIFKKEKRSLFAQLDTKYYSPLCFFITFLAVLVQVFR